jgi:glutamyl-tRNA synthetase
VLGALVEDVAETTGDFVLRRGDGVFAYQLAVVVDDLAMRVTDVVRGADLAASAPRQALLARLLGGEAPGFAHVPLVLGEGGERLAKRAKGVPLADQRASGVRPAALVRAIGAAYGLAIEPAPASAHETGRDAIEALAEVFSYDTLRGREVHVDDILGRLAR